MDNGKTNRVEFFSLWEHVSKQGKRYWSGSLGSARVIVFENDRRGNDKAPALRVYLAPNEKRDRPSSSDDEPAF